MASWLASGKTSARPSLSAPRLVAALGLPASGGSGGPLDLTAAGQAAMQDSEEAAQRRRQIAAVLSLQPFLRDLVPAAAAAAAAPLSEAELQQERQSVATLQAQCAELLGRMPTSAAEDEALLAGAGGEPLGVRRRQAVAARLESKLLLAAAAEGLQRYADALR